MSDKNIDLNILDYPFQIRVNRHKYRLFSEIVKQKGFSNALVLRKFIDSVIEGSDTQLDIFESLNDEK